MSILCPILLSLRGLYPGFIGRVERLECLSPWWRHLRLQVGQADQDPGGWAFRENTWRERSIYLPVTQRDTEVQDEEKMSYRWEERGITGAKRGILHQLKTSCLFLISTGWCNLSFSYFLLRWPAIIYGFPALFSLVFCAVLTHLWIL